MPVENAAHERARHARGTAVAGPQHLAVEPRKQHQQLSFARRAADDDAAARIRRVTSRVEEVTVEGNQCASLIARANEMLAVGRAAKVIVLEDEEDVPAERLAHGPDDAGWKVGVDVHPGRVG